MYIFSATYLGLTANSTSEIIETSEDGKTITIPLGGASQSYAYLLEDVYVKATESFNNVTNISTITFNWEDSNGISQTGCISTYTVIGSTKALNTRNCTSGVSNSYILGFFVNNSYLTEIVAELKNGDSYVPVETFTHLPQSHPSDVINTAGLGAFVVPLLVLIAIAIGLYSENIYIGTAVIVIFTGLSLTIAPTILNKSIVMFFFFIGWLTINYGVKSR